MKMERPRKVTDLRESKRKSETQNFENPKIVRIRASRRLATGAKRKAVLRCFRWNREADLGDGCRLKSMDACVTPLPPPNPQHPSRNKAATKGQQEGQHMGLYLPSPPLAPSHP